MQIRKTTATGNETPVEWVEVNGARLAYVEKGEGEPIVFIHGALSDYRTWSGQIDFFAENYRVVSYSRRFHQPNGAASGRAAYSRASQTDDLIALLEALDLGKAHLIGHSYGAAIALMSAVRRPEMIGSLVLAEPSPFASLFDARGKALVAEQRAGFEQALRLAQSDNTEEAARQFLHTIVGIDVLGLLPRERRQVVLENAGTLEPMLRTYYDAPRLFCRKLWSLTVPALLITGELSPKLARWNNEVISRCLPDARIEILRGASHGLQIENGEGFNQMVLKFLSAHRL